MKITMEFIHAIITVIVAVGIWELLKTNWVKDKIGYLYFICFGLSFGPMLAFLTVTGIVFVCIHQFLAAGFIGGLLLIGLLFRITNGFGVKF
jgi:hypothetical protein